MKTLATLKMFIETQKVLLVFLFFALIFWKKTCQNILEQKKIYTAHFFQKETKNENTSNAKSVASVFIF
ncbi:MAG: hypothetical protein GY914_06130 [Prochlorococcus sp.]|nr:hypothetical protein [Prochlorococcus sp.]